MPATWRFTIGLYGALLISIAGCADPTADSRGVDQTSAAGHDSSSTPQPDRPDDPNTQNVWRDHERTKLDSTEYPWRAIGYIGDVRCTGVLVGPRLVLTAAHCTIKANTFDTLSEDLFFHVNTVHGVSPKKSWIEHITRGTDIPDINREDDWAICQLASPLGDEFGWFDVADTQSFATADNYPYPLVMVGYSVDYDNGNTATIDANTRIRGLRRNFLLHDGSMTRGSSGGPIFRVEDGRAVIYGLSVAEYRGGGDTSLVLDTYKDNRANIAVHTARFLPKLKELLEQQSAAIAVPK